MEAPFPPPPKRPRLRWCGCCASLMRDRHRCLYPSCGAFLQVGLSLSTPCAPTTWVAVKELNLSYYTGETTSISKYTHKGTLIYSPPSVDRIWAISGSYKIPNAMFYLPTGDYKFLSSNLITGHQAGSQV